MNILFKNRTKYTKEIYDTFLEFHRKKYHFSYLAYNVIIIALILFCLTVQVKYHNFTIAILFCCILTGFILWRYLHPTSEVSKEYQSDKIQKEQIFTFKFYKNFFTCENTKEIQKVQYYRLYRIFETDDFFYLYIDRTHSFLVSKTSFNLGKASDFSSFIHKKCFFRYRNSNKKVYF